MTDQGLAILESIKAKYFPNGYRPHKEGCEDYRYSRRGQIEIKRALQARALRMTASLK
ncbi:hypothetical protein [Vibrio taketomensis]|uniref:hypothetical protein n=1 Tax=Vibrio taketomensis TaxID=2572923 RepID=UPI00142F0A52|nr:hypothetical protein [Vibrio taketomensis]